MKSFLQLIEEEKEKEGHHVMAFGRMNPPTTGHLKLIDKVKDVAKKVNGTHSIVVSHSQDSKKNPLSAEQKLRHLRKYSVGTHFQASTKESPTFLHHAKDVYEKGALLSRAKELYKRGVTHLHMVAGSDRVKEYHDKLHEYNGTHKGALFNFKKITVHSAGHRDPDAEGTEGMSGSKMREHAKNKDFSSFRQGVPSHVSDQHARELMNDVRRGMGLHESVDKGVFKAVFITGGPGSGKDVVIREAVPYAKMVEMNSTQIFEYLMDKAKLGEKSNDLRRESIRQRLPLIVNGPADDVSKILRIKEELEELGYETTMIFVNTSNEISKDRNEKLSKTIVESIRQDKWLKSQKNKEIYFENFDNFICFENNGSFEDIEQEITDTYQKLNVFIESRDFNDIALTWMKNQGKLNINDSVNYFLKENENVQKTSRFILGAKKGGISSITKRTSSADLKRQHDAEGPVIIRKGDAATGPNDVTPDNRPGDPNADNIRWDAPKRRKDYIFRTYSESKGKTTTEEESNFSQDKETIKVKKKRFTDAPTVSQRMRNVAAVGPEFDTRQQGTVYPMSGLGDVTYREQKSFKSFKNSLIEAIDDPGANDMGMAGVGSATNKEPLETYKDADKNIKTEIKNKKKKI